LLEVLLSLAVSNIIIVLLLSMMLKYNSAYINITKEYKDYFYSTEALMYIQKEILNSKYVFISNNRIDIYYPSGIEDDINKKCIQLNYAHNLIVDYYKDELYMGTNNILKDLLEFNVNQKNNTIYISLILKNGEKYERCFGINQQP
jgi:hypothetical protein